MQRKLPRTIVYRGRLYVQADINFEYSPSAVRENENAKLVKVSKILERLATQHSREADRLGLILKKNQLDSITYRTWREHKRFEFLFRNLIRWLRDHNDGLSIDKVLKYLNSMKQKSVDFSDYWNGLKKFDIGKVKAIPDKFHWPSAEKWPYPKLNVAPSQYLQRPVR